MKHLLLISLIVILSAIAAAQASSAPGPTMASEWKRYKYKAKNVSVMMPKPPMLMMGYDVCGNTERHSLFAYARQAVYEVELYARAKVAAPFFCTRPTSFDAVRTYETLKEKAGTSANTRPDAPDQFERNFADAVERVYLNRERKLVVALRIHHRGIESETARRFLDSFGFGGQTTDAEVGRLAQIVGDAAADVPSVENSANSGPTADPKMLVTPRASYTDAARRADVNGSVRLRIMLMPDGTVGKITTLSELPHGLTQEAIAAARRIIFLPKVTNGRPEATEITREYTFTIY